MTEVRSTLYSLAVLCIVIGIIEIFYKSGKVKNYSEYIVSLIVLIAILTPTVSFIKNLSLDFEELSVQDSASEDNISSLKQTMALAIKKNISDNLHIPREYLSVDIYTSVYDNEILIEKVNVEILNSDYFGMADRLKAYLQSIIECEVKISQKIEE